MTIHCEINTSDIVFTFQWFVLYFIILAYMFCKFFKCIFCLRQNVHLFIKNIMFLTITLNLLITIFFNILLNHHTKTDSNTFVPTSHEQILISYWWIIKYFCNFQISIDRRYANYYQRLLITKFTVSPLQSRVVCVKSNAPVPFAHRKVKVVYSLLFMDDLCALCVFYLCSFSFFTAKPVAVSKAILFCCIVHCVHSFYELVL